MLSPNFLASIVTLGSENTSATSTVSCILLKSISASDCSVFASLDPSGAAGKAAAFAASALFLPVSYTHLTLPTNREV